VPPGRAAERMKVPEGFRVALVAAEPTLVKPIAMTLDDRGRLWVVESHSYPHWRRGDEVGTDRILILEDREGKGRYDCTVFWDRGTNLSGIAVGHGGVWLCATPHLLFIPVRPGEDKPAGKPVVVLDGWSLDARHNVFNGLIWGPDGWLYGCNGITATSRVGKPGTPDDQRVPMNCGVWRYHPINKQFEVFAWGTTNPWGLDFDDYGEAFITNCVIKHLFHVVPGAHFVRMHGQDLNPHCYGLIESCADHLHWAGGHWTSSRGGAGAHADSGGGHAHAGAMVYLGDNWPAEYRNRIFMCNIHGNRVNQDILERRGSSYVGTHAPDFLFANDSWFRGLALTCGPDGGVYLSDWCDTGECHNYDKVQPRGRIYKVTFGQPRPAKVDLAKLSDEELVKLQLHRNDWWVRHARRLLQERAAAGKLSDRIGPLLFKMLSEQRDVTRQLRALWALHVTGQLDPIALQAVLDNPHPALRAWAVRLLLEKPRESVSVSRQLLELARTETAAPVRLALASGLQRLSRDPLHWGIAERLAARGEDAADPYLPLMLWYGIEPLVPADPERAVALLTKARIPLVRQYVARRLESTPRGLEMLATTLAASDDAAVQQDILRGLHEAIQGRRQLKPPAGWAAAQRKLVASPDTEVRQKALLLSVIFGDAEALATVRKTAADPTAKDDDRRTALQMMLEVRADDLLPLLRELLVDKVMRGPAIRGLAAFNEPSIPAAILRHYPQLTDSEKADAVQTLASRPAYAMALLDAMEKGIVPRRDLSPFTARQLLGFKDKKLTERLNSVWGSTRPPAADRAALLARYRSLVPPDALQKADRSRGRALFVKNCASCHVLFNEGGKIGPELTGSQRTNPEYLLTELLDPNAVVARDYQVTIFETTGGRLINGIVKSENEQTVTIQTQNEVITLPKKEIAQRTRSSQSMMPEGLLAQLSDAEVRDLIAYLAGPGQVPLPGPSKEP
jgi:putative membrane-bound dehydrogenase-like protein